MTSLAPETAITKKRKEHLEANRVKEEDRAISNKGLRIAGEASKKIIITNNNSNIPLTEANSKREATRTTTSKRTVKRPSGRELSLETTVDLLQASHL